MEGTESGREEGERARDGRGKEVKGGEESGLNSKLPGKLHIPHHLSEVSLAWVWAGKETLSLTLKRLQEKSYSWEKRRNGEEK